MHSHAERGNDHVRGKLADVTQRGYWIVPMLRVGTIMYAGKRKTPRKRGVCSTSVACVSEYLRYATPPA